MAKPSKPITISEEDLKNLDAIREKYQKLSEQYEEIRRKGAAITNDEKRRKAFLERKIERQAAYVEKLEQEAKIREGIVKRTEKFNNALKKQAQYLGESEEVYGSIAEKLQKGSEGAELIARHLEDQKGALSDIASLGSEIAGTDEKKQKAIQKALTDYKKYESSVANTVQRVSEGTLSQEKANAAIAKSKAAYMESIQSLTEMGEKGKELLQLFLILIENTEKLGSASTKTAKEFNIMADAVNRLGASIPLVNQLSEAIKQSTKGGRSFAIAMAALGAAVGALAGKYFLAFPQAQLKATNDILQNQIETVRDIAKIRFEADMGPDKTNFLEQKKNLEIQKLGVDTEFNLAKAVKKTQDLQLKGTTEYRRILQGVNVEIAQSVNQFNAASKTALFGKGIGSVGYAKSQLAAAGVSAEDVANNIKQAGVVMGRMPSGEIAATMALMEKRTGASSESIAQINKSFVRLDGLSETSALNMQQGMTQLAEGSKIPLDNLMQEVASSSKEMLGYGIKNTSNLVKQVAAVQSMGVSFETIANAGKSMVLNYKDSIKAEMQLSSLLGQQVDLSEARAAFATGDFKGAVSAIQAQGLDVKNMNMFQLEALSQALGGMDIESITSMLTGQMTQPGELTAASATTGGKQFAAAKLAEKTQISMGSAIISAQDAEVQIQFDREIQEQILNSPFYKEYQQNQANLNVTTKLFESIMYQAWLNTDAYAKSVAELAQLDVKRTFTEGLIPGISAAVGAALFSGLGGMIKGGGEGGLFGNLFKGGGGGGLFGNLFKGGGRAIFGTTTRGLLGKAGPIASAVIALADPLTDAIEGNVQYQSKSTAQNIGNFTASLGANMADAFNVIFTFGGLRALTNRFGMSIKGLDLSELESLRGAYRAMTGEQIGVGAEGTQKLIDWVQKNQKAILATKDGQNEFGSIIADFNRGVASGDIKISKIPTVGTKDITKTTTTKEAAKVTQTTAKTGTSKTTSVSTKEVTSDLALTELKAINTNTKALVELSKAMQIIAAAQYEFSTTKIAPVQLKVDGKTLATAQVSYVNNNKGQKSPGK